MNFDDLIAPARLARAEFVVPNMAAPTVLSFVPMHRDNPDFLDAALRGELAAGDPPQGLDLLRVDAARLVRCCAPGLTIDGEDRTADVAAFLGRLIDLAPSTYQAISRAVAAAGHELAVDTAGVEGNSSPA